MIFVLGDRRVIGNQDGYLVPALNLRFRQQFDVVFDPTNDRRIVFVQVQDAQLKLLTPGEL